MSRTLALHIAFLYVWHRLQYPSCRWLQVFETSLLHQQSPPPRLQQQVWHCKHSNNDKCAFKRTSAGVTVRGTAHHTSPLRLVHLAQ